MNDYEFCLQQNGMQIVLDITKDEVLKHILDLKTNNVLCIKNKLSSILLNKDAATEYEIRKHCTNDIVVKWGGTKTTINKANL